ncbi:cytochrome P450 [Immersiella caudata]|uniref:Cytochrome P450 n=1 Tax=Immersiella caudata TaxID=314043 RepID=A0AA40CD93_9PEZI|nr:cytochrome P450 [Immersiella caudata]
MMASIDIAARIVEFQHLSVRSQVLSVLGLLVVSITFLRSIVSWYRLRHVPGPFINIWTLWIQVWKIARGELPYYYDGLAKKYGPLVRVGPNHVVYSDPETCRRLSAIRSPYTRGPYYEGTRFMPGKDHVGSLIDDKKHAALRKLLAPGYSGLENGGFEASVNDGIARLISLIEKNYLSTPSTLRPFDFASRAMFFAFDTASIAAYSEPLGFLDQDRDPYDLLSRLHAGMPIFASVLIIPGLHKVIQTWPLKLLMPRIGDRNGLGAIMTFINRVLSSRLSPSPNHTQDPPPRDVLTSWLSRPIPPAQLLQEISLQIIAGSDPVATPLRITLLLLLTSPPTLRSFLSEINTGISTGKISSPITQSEALALPYLQAIIRESIRLYPPTLVAYRTVPKGGDTIHGHFLPEGTQVGQNTWGMMRSKETFGEDADVFRPERWIGVDKGRWVVMNETVNLAFGYGKFGCLGKPLAMMEMNKVYVELFRRFEFSLLDPITPMKIRNATLWLISDFWLKVVPREA